ncbi:Nif3-like dinuclear metal center hexameric protein [Boudabousia marimammalium]|uniref:GTP cyclohydrolase 1 type 2 homolog n=1 Tax=Boudabousia marimammalium TaxID=156892 RepID=A0A1Q5PNS6_9ACTO|nr:Nif3-like dinuclear metal center hexameric protein [Boudabousia marimammalium]OKL49206.1 Nif3-like dinuclear metal center hexameric protein [Boudabousia marimammalium]
MSNSDNTPSLEQVVSLIDSLYPPKLKEEWDKVGLITGDPQQPVERILIALDPVAATVDQAIAEGVDLLFTHHPLYLRGTSFLPANDPKGALVHRLIKNGCALMNAHTNADAAAEGVAQALAERIGLQTNEPLVPSDDVQHPGLGRVGKLPEAISLRAFAQQVAKALPGGPNGLLVGGDLEDLVQKVVVSGGSGDSFLGAARAAGADVYVTADLRHHPASEHLEGGKPYLINASHWATESVWCEVAAKSLRREFAAANLACEVKVSDLVTEPWTLWLPTTESE